MKELASLLKPFERALATLRSGSVGRNRDAETLGTIRQGLGALTDLNHRVSGATAALVRAHFAAGGSYGELAAALGVSRATAQTRATRIRITQPSEWEDWATGETGEPQEFEVGQVRPGFTFVEPETGKRYPVSEVTVYETGDVEISPAHGRGVWCFASVTDRVACFPHEPGDVVETTSELKQPGKRPVRFTTYNRTAQLLQPIGAK